METEKSCSLAETMHYSFPVYHSNLFFNISLSKTPSCIPTVVNYAYAVLLNATKQSVLLWSRKKSVPQLCNHLGWYCISSFVCNPGVSLQLSSSLYHPQYILEYEKVDFISNAGV